MFMTEYENLKKIEFHKIWEVRIYFMNHYSYLDYNFIYKYYESQYKVNILSGMHLISIFAIEDNLLILEFL